MAKISFYKELDRLSTADFYRENKNKKASASRLYEIDRVISKRVRKGKREYFIKWKGYPSLQNSWEPEENLNSLALR